MKTFRFIAVLALLYFSVSLTAQVIIAPDTIHNGENITWGYEKTYLIRNMLVIEEGATLNINASTVVFKFKADPVLKSGIFAKGQFNASNCLFTSERDSLGADYNNDGRQTIPKAGDWGYVYLNSGDAVGHSFYNCTFRYGGGCRYTIDSTDIDNATVYQHWWDGRLDMESINISGSKGYGLAADYGNISNCVISGCENGIKCLSEWLTIHPNTVIRNNNNFAIMMDNCFYPSLDLGRESVYGNGIDGIAVTGLVDRDVLWNVIWSPGLPIYILHTVQLKNTRLTILPGTVVRFMAGTESSEKALLIVQQSSSIEALGTPESRISFTSEYDQTVTGSSQDVTPLSTDWGYIQGRNLTFEYCDFKYGGVYFDTTRKEIADSLCGVIRIDETYDDTSHATIYHCNFSRLFKHAIVTLHSDIWTEPPLINYCLFDLPNNCFGIKCSSERDVESRVDARFNYWNSKTGPYHAVTNPTGNGCLVDDRIDYIPFLKSQAGASGMTGTTLKGKITNENGEELYNAKVFLKGRKTYEAYSDSTGLYFIKGIEVGRGYELTAYASGHKNSGALEYSIFPDTVQFYDIVLAGYTTDYLLDTLNFNINPEISSVGENGTAFRFYKIVDKNTFKPVYGVKVYVDDDEDLVFESNQNGIVSIGIPSLKIGDAGTQKEFFITRIGEESAFLDPPVPFTVKVLPYSYLKSWVGEAYIDLGIEVACIHISSDKRRGSSLNLMMIEEKNKQDADSIIITRKTQNGLSLGFSAGLPYSVQLNDMYAGVGAEAGVNMFKMIEDEFQFNYSPNDGKLALAQFIVLADGMLPYMDAPLVRLFVRCLERQNDEIRNACVSSTVGFGIKAYGSAMAGVSLPDNTMEVNLNHGSISGEATAAFKYTNFDDSDRQDFILSLACEAKGDLSLNAGFGMLNLVNGFSYTSAAKYINPIEGHAKAKIHGDLELGTARNLTSPYTWLSMGYGYDYDVYGRLLEKEAEKKDYADNKYTFYFADSTLHAVLKNSASLAKSFLGTLGGEMDLNASTQSMGQVFNNSFDDIACRQKLDPLHAIKLPYEKTVNQEFCNGSFDIRLSFGLKNIISLTFGAGYEFTGINEYPDEKGIFYDYTLYPFEKYPTLANSDQYQAKQIVKSIVDNAANYVWQEIKVAANPVNIFKRLVRRLFRWKSTTEVDSVMYIGPYPQRTSRIEFYGNPLDSVSAPLDSIEIYYWDWYGAGDSVSQLKSTDSDVLKLQNYVRRRATNIHKLDYGIGGFYQFEPYNAPVTDSGAVIKINYLDEELTVMLSDSSEYIVPEENLRLYKEDKKHNRWIYIGGVVDADSNLVIAHIDTLGTFTLAPFVPDGAMELVAYPDTIRLGIHDTSRINSGILYYNTGEKVAPHELYTIDVNVGSILTEDVDNTIAGMQVAANSDRYLDFIYVADTVSGVAIIKVSSHRGNAIGMVRIPITDEVAPECPVLDSAFINEKNVVVQWSASPDPDLVGYKLYYDTISGGPYQGTASVVGSSSPVFLPDVTSTYVKGLEFGKTYYFCLTAIDRSNNESDRSNEIELKTWSNNRPVLYNQKFICQRNVAKGATVGTLIAEDRDAGQKLTFYLSNENTCDVFVLDSITGVLTVDKPEKLSYAVSSFEVKAGVKDNGYQPLLAAATILVQLDPAVSVKDPLTRVDYFHFDPNPASDRLEIYFNKEIQHHGGKIRILNEQGTNILLKDYPRSFPEMDMVDLKSIPAGAYLIVIQTNIGTETEKLIIVK